MEVQVGKVTHYYNRISVAVLDLSGELKVGEMIHILGRITDFDQRVTSMEIEHHKIQSAGQGTEVALKVIEMVRKGDFVFKYVEEDET
jgi:translation elongation factor EF-1alpha